MSVYITSTGHHLPGAPVDNERIEEVLGQVHGRPSRLKRRILKSNGIRTRHYAIDAEHRTTVSNGEMAALAGRDCLARGYLAPSRIDMLSVATSQGDLVLPGFGSMVQADLDLADVELHTSHGICSSSLMALKAAYTALKAEEHDSALVIASELASRLFKASRYAAAGGGLDFDAEFLRWMLSDGAGALLLERRPRGRCFRIDWIRGFSHADAYPVCMSVGQARGTTKSWQDYPTYAEAEAAGALLLRQDVRLLDNVVKLGVDGLLRLVDQGWLEVARIDHLLCHYSSHYFRGKIFDMLTQAGAAIPEERWYTNLYERGNTGCASLFIMLDEFCRTRPHREGERLLCVVPESGRFNTLYMQLTVVEE
ncbi:beta-ketoacyl-ACP synthase III [Halomonas campisalis]|uniref:Beta-ketoacyl-ACP synthase III n=1 Tax=Billgrantia campisalis TaxID=74661 RepID=A0ABS9PB17_9GAMM|nr:beta-ketoacyl-ACP synthase III [Halomonas campisalis]MCG6658462.1 beta-ketoacyl-ACP synthase III [Halomonas campisalis]MDR5863322.1 beta-ketoacyl-ACP synthase III [Halomonas campisalis]